jgi:hypothetical protein
LGIDILHQFREIDGVLALGFNGTDIVGAQIIILIRIPVIPIGLYNNNIVMGHIIGNIVTIVVIPFIKSSAAGASKISLRPTMVKIYHRVSFLGTLIIARG